MPEELMQKYGVHGEHADFTREAWKLEVSDGNTQRGYWEWVSSELEDADSLAPSGWEPKA